MFFPTASFGQSSENFGENFLRIINLYILMYIMMPKKFTFFIDNHQQFSGDLKSEHY